MFSLSNLSAGLPFPANSWLSLPAAQAFGQACQQLTPNQWGMQQPNSNSTWGGSTTNIHFWGGQVVPHMAHAPAQQLTNQPWTIMAYPTQHTPPQHNVHYMPGQPGPAQPPEQNNLSISLAQLQTTVKSQQEEATQRMAQL